MKKPALPPVHLGYQVPTGDAVEIPIRHTVIVGQTQESGKTTTLEALITRSGLRAVTFVTKRGEGSFTNSRRIAPYFRDNAGDWQYVASILEASRGEKMKMERSSIIRACQGQTTLKGVHANIRRLVADPKVRGFAADMYLCLNAYLDVVVPEIDRIDWADALILSPGVNAVDLTDVPSEMQHLVIQSSLDWVLTHEADTIVVIPEAWKFVPESRKTPVKLSAVALIRQGAALRNYVWLDSQDIGGISKEILRSCPVWLLGVQREANEIDRTLDNIPEGRPKLKRSDISTLTLGQFFAVWGTHAIKTYVQPEWMNAAQAQQVADGSLTVDLASRLSPGLGRARVVTKALNRISESKEKTVNVTEANAIKEENQQLRTENTDLRRRLEALERADDHRGGSARAGSGNAGGRTDGVLPKSPDIQPAADRTSAARARTSHPHFSEESENLYQAIKARLIEEVAFGGKVFEVMPAAKLRLDFQREEVDRILQSVRELSPLAKKTLTLLESLEGKRLTQADINRRLGRSINSKRDMGDAVAAMIELGLMHSDKNGTAARVRDKIAEDLATYSPESYVIDDCHQAVLHALATEA